MTRFCKLSVLLALIICNSAALVLCAADNKTDPSAETHPNPQTNQKTEPKQSYQVKRNIVYAEVEKTKLRLDAYIPDSKGPHPSLLLVHGGGWTMGNKSHMGSIARAAAAKGYVCFSIKYRLAPKFKFPAQIEDCRTATRWMVDNAKKYKIDLKRMGAIGYSAGGHLVALLGAQGVKHKTGKTETIIRFKVIGAGGTPTDFRWMPPEASNLAYWLGGTRKDLPQRYIDASPLAFVNQKSAPIFFFHGERDNLVPLLSPQVMVNVLRQAGVDSQLHIVKGANHISAFGNSQAYETMDEFFAKHLKADTQAKDTKDKPKHPATADKK